jgi:hypothetical protein
MSNYEQEKATTKKIRVSILLMRGSRLDIYLSDNDQTKARLAEFVSQMAGGKMASLEDENGALHLLMCVNIEFVRVSDYAYVAEQ